MQTKLFDNKDKRRNISVVIPAFNEQTTVGNVVRTLAASESVREVIVVNNGSTDSTSRIATDNGAIVVDCMNRGMGYAMKKGIRLAKSNLVVKTDADIINPNENWPYILAAASNGTAAIVSGKYDSNYDQFPLTYLTAKPALELFFPKLSFLSMPLSGTYFLNRDLIGCMDELPNDWSFDLSMLLMAHLGGLQILEAEIGWLIDRPREIIEYRDAALNILSTIHNFWIKSSSKKHIVL